MDCLLVESNYSQMELIEDVQVNPDQVSQTSISTLSILQKGQLLLFDLNH